jgi:hypothetical protein
MNKQIKELAEQAGMYVDLNGNPWPKWMSAEECELAYAKFAELIVRECVTQCEQVATDADAMAKSKFVTDAGRMLHEGMWGGAKNCGGQIKEHFGVEE